MLDSAIGLTNHVGLMSDLFAGLGVVLNTAVGYDRHGLKAMGHLTPSLREEDPCSRSVQRLLSSRIDDDASFRSLCSESLDHLSPSKLRHIGVLSDPSNDFVDSSTAEVRC